MEPKKSVSIDDFVEKSRSFILFTSDLTMVCRREKRALTPEELAKIKEGNDDLNLMARVLKLSDPDRRKVFQDLGAAKSASD